MIRTHWTREEALSVLDKVNVGGLGSVQVPVEVIELIMYAERLFYNQHTDDIRARQDKLAGMWQNDSRFLAFWFPTERYKFSEIKDIIAPGCHACLFGMISHVRHSYKCSQSCEFCYYASEKSSHHAPPIGKNLYSFSGTEMNFTLDEVNAILDRQATHYDAIGWLQKEPLEELDNIQPVMEKLAKLGVHQYMYTNGVHASRETIDKLATWGLNEIRFNLQATDFSKKIISRIKYAKEKISWVLIETPIYSKSYENYLKYKDDILDTGLDQINMPELQICALDLLDQFVETDGPVYKHRRGYVSPISSRHYTYNLIEMAEKESWPVIINDCSNDTKFFRGIATSASLGYVNYTSPFELPFKHVMYLVDQVMEEGVEYEFF